jgi:D-aminopeptidase
LSHNRGMSKPRLRDLGIRIGAHEPGPLNAITDIPGVLVGQTTLHLDTPRIARTGVTVISPREGTIWRDNCFAGFHSFNGCGEMTGIHWIKESGLLCSPIAITCTHQVGIVHAALVKYGAERAHSFIGALPVVAETWDGYLNDANAHHLTEAHVFAALDGAHSGSVAEGNTGGGAGMICYEFKGGTGTASRRVTLDGQTYTVGVLVQTNHGARENCRVDGVPVGHAIPVSQVPGITDDPPQPGSSIIIIVGTDAPLIPTQCDRLAQRATVGLARTGGYGYNGSGDLFLAFSTGNDVSESDRSVRKIRMLAHRQMNVLFEATADAVEEAIVNSMLAAETMHGFEGHIVHALPHDALQTALRQHGRLSQS